MFCHKYKSIVNVILETPVNFNLPPFHSTVVPIAGRHLFVSGKKSFAITQLSFSRQIISNLECSVLPSLGTNEISQSVQSVLASHHPLQRRLPPHLLKLENSKVPRHPERQSVLQSSHSTTPPPVFTSSSAPKLNTEPASHSSTSFTSIVAATISAPGNVSYSAPLSSNPMHRDLQRSIQQFNVPCPKAGSSSATQASGMQLDTPDRTHQLSDLTSRPIHASITLGRSSSVGTSANVSLASGGFAPAHVTTTIMPTATVNALAPPNMNMLYMMQQQMNMLE
ncbi:unnamed protein product [Ceratitis capitata]|uniref:(Mediterranean fruit fly) hypothetical protein n=1 Tax=Ceratitis capitata TaxID=7213 RepID=A0A811URE1_CERCA|nr:unnamed protein product [Ceratitis capitata]